MPDNDEDVGARCDAMIGIHPVAVICYAVADVKHRDKTLTQGKSLECVEL